MYVSRHNRVGEGFARLGKHEWSVARLIDLSKDFPVQEAPIDAFNVFNRLEITLRELAAHVIQVNEADLQYPIILDEDGEIMDGRHRLVKSMVEGRETIRFVKFQINPPPCKINED